MESKLQNVNTGTTVNIKSGKALSKGYSFSGSKDEIADIAEEIQRAAATEGIAVETLPELAEKYLKRIPVKFITLYPDYYEAIISKTQKLKFIRFLDILFSFLLMILSLPFFLLSAAYMLIMDGGPIFYMQKRIGYRGKPFMLYKLRTYDDRVNDKGETQVISTKSGYMLRKFRINEIPQLINVLRGEMSLVGPRPDIVSEYEEYSQSISNYSARLNCLPGVTGHAQVYYQYCRTREEFERRLEYDLYCIKNQSVLLYILTLLRTVTTVILGKGK